MRKKETFEHVNNEEIIFHYCYSDGFGERLLSIELLVDLDLNYILTYMTFRTEQKKIAGRLPDYICEEIKELMECNLSLLARDYNVHEGATDLPTYYVTINQYGKNWNFIIGETPFVSKSVSNEEKAFFSTLNSLKDWVIKRTGYAID